MSRILFSQFIGPIAEKHIGKVKSYIKNVKSGREKDYTFQDNYIGFEFIETKTAEGSVITIMGDGEDVNIKNCLTLIKNILCITNTHTPIAVEWSVLPLPGKSGYMGGGAAVVTQADIKVMTTRQWLKSEINTNKRKRKRK